MSSSVIQDRGRSRLRRRWLVALSATSLVVAMSAVGLPAATAVHDTGEFELDGNATTATSADWDRVCHQAFVDDEAAGGTKFNHNDPCPTVTTGTPSATAVDWTAEPGLSASIFTGGGSKDPQDITSWAWKNAGGLPDKDNLLHAFAARYSLTPGPHCASLDPTCEVIFFGSDRYDNSGDAQQAFWFLQNPVAATTTTSVGGGYGFTGKHQDNDVLIISDFSVGGTTSTITVYKWWSACAKAGQVITGVGTCGDANLLLLSSSTGANCATATDGDAFCGEVNAAGVSAPWSFTDKSGTANNGYLAGEFYEAGLNLSNLGLGDKCFSTVVAETRSSTSTTATLKDFVVGNFADCSSHVATSAKQGDGSDLALDRTLSIGGGSVQASDEATVTVAGVSTWTGTVTFYLCGTSATSCSSTDTSAVQIGSPVDVSNSQKTVSPAVTATITKVGTYCWHATFTATSPSGLTGAEDPGTDECFTVAPATPTLATSAGPDVYVGQPITDTATLTGLATTPRTPAYYATGTTTTAGGDVTGTVTFKLYGPSDTGCGLLVATVSGKSISNQHDGTYTAAVVSGDNVTASTPGTYHWVADYSGDTVNNNGAQENYDSSGTPKCKDVAEDVVVSAYQPALTTAQNWLPNDTATITVGGGGNLAGSVTFELYGNSTCSGTTPLWTDPNGAVSVSGPSGTSVTSRNTTYFVTSSTQVWWKVSYTSTNGAQLGIPASCVENTSLTVANTAGP